MSTAVRLRPAPAAMTPPTYQLTLFGLGFVALAAPVVVIIALLSRQVPGDAFSLVVLLGAIWLQVPVAFALGTLALRAVRRSWRTSMLGALALAAVLAVPAATVIVWMWPDPPGWG